MEMDLQTIVYDHNLYNKYIYGSAEVVGLMCLKVFVSHQPELYHDLEAPARSLGSAFKKSISCATWKVITATVVGYTSQM